MMHKYYEEIQKSGLSIYDLVPENLYIPDNELELILRNGLKGFNIAGLAIRTRSKIVKSKICEILGYPIPKNFLKNATTIFRSKF